MYPLTKIKSFTPCRAVIIFYFGGRMVEKATQMIWGRQARSEYTVVISYQLCYNFYVDKLIVDKIIIQIVNKERGWKLCKYP